jgi:NADH:ubiquinone oxidoreductase subunit E
MRAVPQRKRYLFVCVSRRAEGILKGSCVQRGSVEIHAALKAELAARGLAQIEARACTASCLDVCWAGPAIAVAPDGYFCSATSTRAILHHASCRSSIGDPRDAARGARLEALRSRPWVMQRRPST